MICLVHDFLVEVGLWDSRDHFLQLQLSLPMLDICIGSSMLRNWMAAAFLCAVFLLVLRLVSVVVLWFALPAVGYALLFLFFFIIAPDLRVLLAVLVPLLLHFFLLATGSLALVLGFSPLALWLWFLLCFFSESLGGRKNSVARFWLPSNITTQHCARRD